LESSVRTGMDFLGQYRYIPGGKEYYRIYYKNPRGDYSYTKFNDKRKEIVCFLTLEQISIFLNRGGIELNPGPLTNLLMSGHQQIFPQGKGFSERAFGKYIEEFGFVLDPIGPPTPLMKVYSYDIEVFYKSEIYMFIISFQFNPFLPDNLSKIKSYVDDGRFIRGRYEYKGNTRKFVFDRESPLSRVHLDIWEQYFDIPEYEGYDLVSNFQMLHIGIRGPLFPLEIFALRLVEDTSYQHSCSFNEDLGYYEDVTYLFKYVNGDLIYDLSRFSKSPLEDDKYFKVFFS